MPDSVQVLVVGAGPAGAALAYLLASRGIEVTLLERQRDFAREFRGEVLMPGGMQAIHEMGLSAAFQRVPRCVPTSIEVFLGGRSFFRLDLAAAGFGDTPAAAVSQPALLEMLVEEAARFPGFQLLRGASVMGLLYDGGRVVGVRARTKEGESELEGRFVVGADGRASAVRAASRLAPPRAPVPLDVVWCKLPLPGYCGPLAPTRAYLGSGHLLIAYRSWDDQLQVAWVIRKGTFGELKSRGMDQWIDEMAGHVSEDLAAHFRRHRGDFSRPFLLDAALDRVTRWSAPGMLLIGDAAHTMSPVGAQGLNVALRDAIVAANALVPACLSGAGPDRLDAAARRVERERLPEVARVQRLQSLPPHVVLGTTRAAELVRRVLPFVARSRLGQALVAAGARPFVFGREAVRLEV